MDPFILSLSFLVLSSRLRGKECDTKARSGGMGSSLHAGGLVSFM